MSYVHGTDAGEQRRLTLMNRLINEPSLQRLGLAGGERILDVGCGLAQFTRAMARAAGSGGRVVGVERDADQLDEGRRQAEADGETGLVELRPGDALALPLSDEEWGSFDVVHSRFLLEHLADPRRAVGQMVWAARPGGRIVLQDDDHDVLRVWPTCAPFERLWRVYYETYTAAGNDPYVGRKLTALLHDAGAKPAANTWIFYGSCAGDPDFPLFIENILGVLDGARDTILGLGGTDDAAIDTGLESLQAWSRRSDAAFWYCMCWAEGRRPG
ncbi:MAG: methyltransferase domain-containing protein [Planctomycetota bacterium]